MLVELGEQCGSYLGDEIFQSELLVYSLCPINGSMLVENTCVVNILLPEACSNLEKEVFDNIHPPGVDFAISISLSNPDIESNIQIQVLESKGKASRLLLKL